MVFECFGKSLRSWARYFVAGWQVNAITTMQSGPTIVFATRPDVVPGVSAKLDNPSIDKWFNTAAFKPAAPFTYGNASRTIPNVAGRVCLTSISRSSKTSLSGRG